MTIWPRRLLRCLRVLFRGGAVHREIEDEVRFHVEMEARSLVEAGMDEAEARRTATLRLGGFDRTVEEGRDAYGGRHLGELVRAHGFAVRRLVHAPRFAASAVLTLGLGLGSATALHTLVDGVLLRPLPFEDADRLELVGMLAPDGADGLGPFSPLDFGDLLARSRSYEGFAAYAPGRRTLRVGDLEPVLVAHASATADFFTVLGQSAALGRVFVEDEGVRGAEPVAVLSDGLWTRAFGRDPSVIGRTLTLDDAAVTVVGVLEPGLTLPRANDIWTNYSYGFTIGSRRARWLNAVGRLSPDAGAGVAHGELARVAAELADEYPASNAGWSIAARPFVESLVGSVRPTLLLLFGATSLLLLLSVTNVAGLIVAASESRGREFALRGALGAGPGHVVRQLLAEASVLAGSATVVAIGLAALLVDAARRFGPADVPRLAESSLGAGNVAFVVLAAALATAALTLLPARSVLRGRLGASFHRGGVGVDPRGRRVLRILVGAQVALSTVLLVGGGLLARSVARLLDEDIGFEPDGVVALEVTLPAAGYESLEAVEAFHTRLRSLVAANAAVASASIGSALPLADRDDPRLAYTRTDVAAGSDESPPMAVHRRVGEGYFDALGIDVTAGRAILDSDGPDAPGVVVINESLARSAFGSEDPIGRRLEVTAGNFGARSAILVRDVEIVGVVADARYQAPGVPASPALYLSHRQAPFATTHVLARATRSPEDALAALRDGLRALDPALAGGDPIRFADAYRSSTAHERLTFAVLVSFALAALGLACVGVFMVVGSAVARREPEVALRRALGAGSGRVLHVMLTDTWPMVVGGVAVGVVTARLLSSRLQGTLHDVSASDAFTFVVVSAVVSAVALAAGLIPVLGALGRSPADTLRRG